MKNLKYLFLSLALGLLSCESELEKTYDELGNIPSPVKTDLKYTLVDADYAAIDGTSKTDDYEKFKGIPSEEDAIAKLPAVILSKLVRVEGAIAVITYNLYKPNTLTSSSSYTVTTADYTSQGGNISRFQNFSNETEVANFLKSKYPAATKGTGVKLTYKIFSGGVQTLTNTFIFNSNNVWEATYTLVAADYTALGESFTNFSDKTVAENRIAIYLKSTLLPYATTGDTKSVIFTYTYRDSSNVRQYQDILVKYQYDGSKWAAIPALTVQTANFKYKSGVWVSNNVIKYTFVTADYTAAATGLASVADLADEVSNLTNFGNFNRTAADTAWNTDEMLQALNVVLKKNFPNTEVGQEYLVTVSVYNGASTVETFAVVLTATGYVYFVQ